VCTFRAVAIASLAIVACGDPSPRDQFAQDVLPLLESSCLATACHGVAIGAEDDGEVIDWSYFHVRVDDDLRAVDVDAAYEAAKGRINTTEPAELSTLLRKPLAVMAGGDIHGGGEQWRSTDGADYRTVLQWARAESDGGEGGSIDELTPNQQLFADEVLPHLAVRQCMNQACHGPFAPFTAFAPPVMIEGEPVFGVDAIARNYEAARMHLHLGGDPLQSRLVRKGAPLDNGGIAHRGGNDNFFFSSGGDLRADPAVDAIARWAEAERASEIGAEPAVAGIVFVRGPAAPQAAFGHDAYAPGSDLWVLEPPDDTGVLRNLTESAHAGPADVRDPAVSHDATRIAFAMRTAVDAAFNIYEIGVDGTGLVQLTTDELDLPGGGAAHSIQPTYGPDGRIYFVSTRAGAMADGYDVLDTDVWAVDPLSRDLERMTHEPSPVATPSFIGTGKSYGTLSMAMRRTIGGRYEAPVLRVPLDHNKAHHGDSELHIHHGVTMGGDIVYAMRTLPDGRFVCALIDATNQWRAGRLAVFERQFGPELPIGDEADAAVGGFRHAFSVIDPDTTAGGVSPGGAYRHPVPLPDGQLMYTYAPGPVDLDDPAADPDFGIYIAGIGTDGLIDATVLVDEPGIFERDAEPIVVRPLEDDPSHALAWDPNATTGVLALRHVRTLEALFTNLEQRGIKQLRDDIAYARLIEAVAVTPDELAAPIGLGDHVRARVLAEVPLMGGSVYARVPANRPFRVQFLDADRMAIGTQQNRWVDVAPGEKFPGGVSPALYATLCASCHGALTGLPGDVGGPIPDAITAASVTLATHDGLDPRRPREPLDVGDDAFAIDFRRDVLPLVERSCATGGCHAGASPAAGLDLESSPTADFDTTYEALIGNGYVDATGSSARRSYVVERIVGRELDAPRSLDGESCPGDPALTADEILAIVRWIDTGAVYRGEESP
jgi:hypothetical protein